MAFPRPGKLLAGVRFSGLRSDALCCESECFTVPKGESSCLSPLSIVLWVAYYDRDLTSSEAVRGLGEAKLHSPGAEGKRKTGIKPEFTPSVSSL